MNKFLVLLKFRTFPFAFSLSAPNELEQEYIPLDGALSFVEYYQNVLSREKDWRIRYLEDTLNFEELKTEPKIRSSYLLPTMQLGNMLIVETPAGFKVKIQISNSDKALLFGSIKERKSSWQMALRLTKRDDVLKSEITRRALGIEYSRKSRSLPNMGRGPYKAVDYTLKIKHANILWVAVVEGTSKDTLQRFLTQLTRFGIGKKRNMGWGDLLEFSVYSIESENVSADYVIHEVSKKERYLEIIRPIDPQNLEKVLKGCLSRHKLIISSQLGYGAERPPYWQKNIVIKSALFRIA